MATTYTISGIPSTYDDLVVYMSFRQASAGIYAFYLSSNTATTGVGGMSRTTTGTNQQNEESNANGIMSGYLASSATAAGTYANSFMYIPNYTSTSLSLASCGNFSMVDTATTANTWYMAITGGFQTSSGSALSSLVFTVLAGNIAAGTKIDIYGVKNT